MLADVGGGEGRGCIHGCSASLRVIKSGIGDGADGLARIADAAGDLKSALGYLFVAAVEVEAKAEGLLALLVEV